METVITQAEAIVNAIKPGYNGWEIELYMPQFDKFLDIYIHGKIDLALQQRMNILVKVVRRKYLPEKIVSVALESLFYTKAGVVAAPLVEKKK